MLEHNDTASLNRDNEIYEEITKVGRVQDVHTRMLCKLFEIAKVDTTKYVDDIEKSKISIKPKWAD